MADSLSELIALYGGTFDPVHYGHIKSVIAMAKAAQLKQVIVLPNNVPPHRPQPDASGEQRKTMVQLAVAGNPLFTVDCRELERDTPSWTVATLETFRREYGPEQPLAFIIGQDSLLTLHKWYQHEKILSLCHLLVCRRPGYLLTLPEPGRQQWLEDNLVTEAHLLHQSPCGSIFLADTPEYAISATEIRTRLANNSPCDDLLPDSVLDYIRREHLYQS
jgi:nicotinate-nucleotide adenylyltransferase